MKPETFIILTPGFPENESDSTCLPSQQLFVKLLKQQHPSTEVVVISFQYPFAKADYQWNGCRVIALCGRRQGNLRRLLTWGRAWKALKRLRGEKKIKGLLSFWCGECALVGHRFAKQYNLLHKCWLLGQDAKAGNSYVRRIRPVEEELIAMSDFLAVTFFENYGIRPAHIVPNGIDPAAFGDKQQPGTVDILGVGSLIPLKQYDIFIAIIAEIKNVFPAVKAVIAGKGPEEETLRKLIAQYQLENNIYLAGELSHEAVIHLMQGSKILLHPSAYEGFSTVCLEALASGCTVISLIKPMNQEIKNWITVSSQKQMTEASVRSLREPIEKIPVIQFTMQESVETIMRLFEQ